MSIGVAVGKFYPFHKGHRYLIETARANVDDLYVFVCYRHAQEISPRERASWIRELFPDVTVGIIDQDLLNLADSDSKAWAQATIQAIGQKPDKAFTSEDYGHDWCRDMGSEHVLVDQERIRIPVSGTQIRTHPLENLKYLGGAARSYYTVRTCVIGAESTGKTTLCEDLAKHYGISYVPEFGRHYTQAMPDPKKYKWDSDDFVTIARVQNRFESDFARYGGPLIISDTNAYVTQVFEELYLGTSSPEVQALARAHTYDMYFLTSPEMPFEQDHMGTRREEARMHMHYQYEDYLRRLGKPYLVLKGDEQARLKTATEALDELLAKRNGNKALAKEDICALER